MDSGRWEFVKDRTAADGAVWRSADGTHYKRTGGSEVCAEAAFQRHARSLGYPVPRITADGVDGDVCWFVEESLGPASLHDRAAASVSGGVGTMPDAVVADATEVAARLLTAQAEHAASYVPGVLRDWVEHAGFIGNVFTENPDLDTPRVREVIGRAVDRAASAPVCPSHFDYGLPNAFPAGIIDWQHHGLAPLGYDVCPALEIIAYKGGSKGYTATAAQRARYLDALDVASTAVTGRPVSRYLGEFLFVKSLFFLALMRPDDMSRADKVTKWQYRRAVFLMGADQYERSGTINTATFPTLAEFAVSPQHCAADRA